MWQIRGQKGIMSWMTPGLRNSIYGLLGHSEPSDSLLVNRMEDIRETMLELLGDEGARFHPSVTRRIRYATDIQALWYLRGDLMAVLAGVHGEASARRPGPHDHRHVPWRAAPQPDDARPSPCRLSRAATG